MANGNGKKKIGGKLGTRAGLRAKGGRNRDIMSEAIGGVGMAAGKKKAKAKKRTSVIGAHDMISSGVRKSIPLGTSPKVPRRYK